MKLQVGSGDHKKNTKEKEHIHLLQYSNWVVYLLELACKWQLTSGGFTSFPDLAHPSGYISDIPTSRRPFLTSLTSHTLNH